jgi:hypothetical protein
MYAGRSASGATPEVVTLIKTNNASRNANNTIDQLRQRAGLTPPGA